MQYTWNIGGNEAEPEATSEGDSLRADTFRLNLETRD